MFIPLAEARRICAANGRIEVCDLRIGGNLSNAPADPDGLWPCREVRDAFEAVPSNEILEGFETGVLNQRGTTSRGLREGGEQERDFLKKFQLYAEKFKFEWPRTAQALRRIVDFYEKQARWYDERAESRF